MLFTDDSVGRVLGGAAKQLPLKKDFEALLQATAQNGFQKEFFLGGAFDLGALLQATASEINSRISFLLNKLTNLVTFWGPVLSKNKTQLIKTHASKDKNTERVINKQSNNS